MAEDIKGLIEKIQQEGIKAAEDKAKEIEHETRRRAETVLAEAKKKAQKLIADAQAEVAKMEQSSRTSLEQAGRDLLLALRAEINAMLNKLMASDIRQALEPDELSKIIIALIKGMAGKQHGEVIVSLEEKDLKRLQKGLLRRLADEVKKGITLRPSREIGAGFLISYDGGKSHYDFSDKGIAEYLSKYLKPKLAELLKTERNKH